ncbi:SDR family oxidoreductase [Microbacterium kribbense]|uniref:SDR family oxidoreductase n=1 Tax=Microbacterium kribbense TaxID=433645 RepID=A0ABP7GEH7_9MICO
MSRVLLLGGTGWLGSRIAERFVAAGADVTCLARGVRPAPAGTRPVAADRTRPGAYTGLTRTEWDKVVDVTSDAHSAADAVAALGDTARHWTFVSTVSVYADDTVVGADESAELVEPDPEASELDYPQAKAAAEASVRAGVGPRAAIIRPGLIVGPGDPSDRFGYWVGRFASAGAEPVLVPDAAGRDASVIDVDDLADFIHAAGADGWVGTANAVGDPVPLDDVLAAARAVAGHTGPTLVAGDEWLTEHSVAYWAGPRSLPLWMPREMVGFATRSNAVFHARGGRLRPLAATLQRTLDDERARGLRRDRRAGLTRAEERELLRALA